MMERWEKLCLGTKLLSGTQKDKSFDHQTFYQIGESDGHKTYV